MVEKLVIIGPAWPLRGGLAAFDEKLATTFINKGIETSIDTFSLQYPSFLFPGTTQYTHLPAPKGIIIHESINSINPFNWIKIGLALKRQAPTCIIVRFWLPFFAPSLGTICRIAKINKKIKIIALIDNMIPHEKRIGDYWLTKYFAGSIDGYITMSEKVKEDVRYFSKKPILVSPHPIFDHFGKPISKMEARNILKLDATEKWILFFGFIRKYKGLDILIEAMAHPAIKALGIKLMVVGEFYEESQPYYALIEQLGLQDSIKVVSHFVADEEVKNYVCSADFIIQPYKNATQSGVTPLAYHFEKPMLVTNVGALADTVPNEKVGLVVEPNLESIVLGIINLYAKGEAYFIPYIKEEKIKYSWEQMAQNFLNLNAQL